MIIKTVEQGSCGFLIVPNPANKQTQMVNNYKDVDTIPGNTQRNHKTSFNKATASKIIGNQVIILYIRYDIKTNRAPPPHPPKKKKKKQPFQV